MPIGVIERKAWTHADCCPDRWFVFMFCFFLRLVPVWFCVLFFNAFCALSSIWFSFQPMTALLQLHPLSGTDYSDLVLVILCRSKTNSDFNGQSRYIGNRCWRFLVVSPSRGCPMCGNPMVRTWAKPQSKQKLMYPYMHAMSCFHKPVWHSTFGQ